MATGCQPAVCSSSLSISPLRQGLRSAARSTLSIMWCSQQLLHRVRAFLWPDVQGGWALPRSNGIIHGIVLVREEDKIGESARVEHAARQGAWEMSRRLVTGESFNRTSPYHRRGRLLTRHVALIKPTVWHGYSGSGAGEVLRR